MLSYGNLQNVNAICLYLFTWCWDTFNTSGQWNRSITHYFVTNPHLSSYNDHFLKHNPSLETFHLYHNKLKSFTFFICTVFYKVLFLGLIGQMLPCKLIWDQKLRRTLGLSLYPGRSDLFPGVLLLHHTALCSTPLRTVASLGCFIRG